MKNNKYTKTRGLLLAGLIVSAMTGVASANAGATAITDEIELLIPVAAAVIGVAVLVVVIPWGARMAIKAFKSICG